MKKNLFILISFVVIIVLFSLILKFVEPIVDIESSVNKITTEEYSKLKSTDQLVYGDINNYRCISLTVRYIQPPFLISNRSIKIDSLENYLMQNPNTLVLSGGTTKHDDIRNNYAEYNENAYIVLRNITDKELIDYLRQIRINTSWSNFYTNTKRVYYFTDYL